MHTPALLLAVALVPASLGLARQPAQAADIVADAIVRAKADEGALRRFHGPWISKLRRDRLRAFANDTLASLDRYDWASLSQDQRIDRLLLRDDTRALLAELILQDARAAEIEPLVPFAQPILDLARARTLMQPVDARAAADIVAGIPDLVAAARNRVNKENKDQAGGAEPVKVSPVLARRASRAISELRGTLTDWFEYHNNYSPEFSWWLRSPHEKAAQSLDDFARFLREEVAGLRGGPDEPLVGDPLGRDALLDDLKREVIAYTPEELIAIGEKEFSWCEAELRKASAEMGLGDDVAAAIAKVKQGHVPPGEQAALVTQQAREAIAFVRDNDLVTVPPLAEELWRIRMIDADGQRSLPFAAYSDMHMLVAYPTEQMPHADKLMSFRGNNRHFNHIVTPHELIPGHHLQNFIAERERPYRRTFSTPFYVEGWALYWEMKLWDMGYGKTPEDRIGMLFWRMHRCARIIVSLKFHLGQMSPPEMIDFLTTRVGLERFGATSEVRRYIGGDYSPLYQVGYMIGGKQLRALHKEAVGPGRLSERAFNDAVLKCNSMPIEYVRASILGTPLTPDHEASWRFADDAK
jgi:uncharacterized protein (DUF885 family)